MSYDIDDEVLGTGNTSFGGVVTVNTDSTEVVSGVTTTIVSIAATHSSLKVLVNINPDIGSNTPNLRLLNLTLLIMVAILQSLNMED